jgi:hypothetical protein
VGQSLGDEPDVGAAAAGALFSVLAAGVDVGVDGLESDFVVDSAWSSPVLFDSVAFDEPLLRWSVE